MTVQVSPPAADRRHGGPFDLPAAFVIHFSTFMRIALTGRGDVTRTGDVVAGTDADWHTWAE
jgi:hypothetical protein